MPSENPVPPKKVGNGKYHIDKKLGAGCFGEVWRGYDSNTKEPVAVKFEDTREQSAQLETEANLLKFLNKDKPQGFAQCFYWGQEGRFNCMVMEMLGRSLEDRVQGSSGKFTVNTTVLVADQLLRRIEYLHSYGIVHRDIKPENFMFGIQEKIHHVYLIDFGLCNRYFVDQKHIHMRTKLSLTGTARYASINTHKGLEQSRRDDLEAIGHMLLYFLRGALPWSGLDAKTREEKYKKICQKKEQTPLDELCSGFPDEFKLYLKRTRELDFKARPDYVALRQLFHDVREKVGPLEDHQFPWLENKEPGPLVPLHYTDGIQQPDDGQAPSKVTVAKKTTPKGCCFRLCGSKADVVDTE